jgi:hypothetical protein
MKSLGQILRVYVRLNLKFKEFKENERNDFPMRMTKKVVSLVLAVLMVATMMVVGVVSASAMTASDLEAALNAGGNVTLDSDVTRANGFSVPAGKSVVLDLAGYELKVTGDVALRSLGGELTIKDSVGTGKVTAQEMCVMAFYGGTVTIESGTYTAIDNAVFGTNGSAGKGGNTFNINGGTFNGGITSAGYVACGIYAPNNDTWNVNGGTFNITNGVGVCQRAGTVNIADGVVFNVTGDGTNGKVGDSNIVIPSGTGVVFDSRAGYPGKTDADQTIVTGGTFNTAQEAAEFINATGDTNNRIAISGGSFDTAPAAEFVTAPTATADGRTYVGVNGVITTLQEYVDACTNGGSYVLGNNLTFNGTPTVAAGKTLVLDLAGHKLQSLNSGVIWNKGTLTIKDSDGNGQMVAQEYCVAASHNATTTIEGGTYTAKDNAVLLANGSSGYGGCTWNVNDGTFNGNIETAGYVACGIYAANDDTWNVNGGTFNITNGVGICQRAGVVNVADGVVFNVTGDGTEGKVGDSRIVVPAGAGVVFDSTSGYPGKTDASKANVDGGTFNTSTDSVVFVNDNGDTNQRIEVSGGTFSTDVTEFCAADLVAASDGNGKFEIVTDPTKAEIAGFQKKASNASADETGVRILTKIDDGFSANADEYGYVVAKVSSKAQATAKFANLKKDGGNGEKTIDCTGSYNNGVGLFEGEEVTSANYVTLAVNGMQDGDQVAARFYVVKDGKTYYANYVNVVKYGGIIATYEA